MSNSLSLPAPRTLRSSIARSLNPDLIRASLSEGRDLPPRQCSGQPVRLAATKDSWSTWVENTAV